jgi:predicted lysophospholipase L1 biosynthesis ABC-type transport system permease subunit
VNFSPRVMLRLDELDATGLVQPASRVTWRLLVRRRFARRGSFSIGAHKGRLPRVSGLRLLGRTARAAYDPRSRRAISGIGRSPDGALIGCGHWARARV